MSADGAGVSDREALAKIALAHLLPPAFAGGSWTLNPDRLADAILAAGFGDKAEAWDEGWDERALWTGRKRAHELNPYRT